MNGIYISGISMPEEGWHKVIKIFSDGTVVSYYDSETLGKAISAADVAPVRHGQWINRGWSTVCSECGEDYAFAKRNYCPNCGAKMDLEGIYEYRNN